MKPDAAPFHPQPAQPKAAKRKTAQTLYDVQHRRKKIAEYLLKAGFRTKAERLQRAVFWTAIAIVAAISAVSFMVGLFLGGSLPRILLFNLGLWSAVLCFVYLLLWAAVLFYLDMRMYNRTKEVEEVLPDFLQLTSANISAGMPIDRALWFAVRPNFGVLAREIEEVAKATIAGEELNQSLLHFTEKYDSQVLRRSINILLEGMAAGGEIASLLNKIAQDIQEMKVLRKEMSANVTTYAIFITFASIVMAPILFALASELLAIIVRITGSLDLSGSATGFFTLNLKTSPEMVADFRWFSVFMLSVTAVMSAAIVSVIRKGRVKEGLRSLPIYVGVSLLIYFVMLGILHSALSSVV